jgi:hypothetical protein
MSNDLKITAHGEKQDLGYANGWKNGTPDIVKNCKHDKKIKQIRMHVEEYSCEICGFKFKVDSSG